MTMFDRLDTACMFYLFSLKDSSDPNYALGEDRLFSLSVPPPGPSCSKHHELSKGFVKSSSWHKIKCPHIFCRKKYERSFCTAKTFHIFFSPKMAVFLHTKSLILNFNVIKKRRC